MDSPDWDDLRYLLAVARHGSAAAAARALGVTHATVLRRLQALEKAFGLRAFERSGGRFRLSDAGQPLFAMAEGIEQQLQDTRRRVAARQAVIEGKLRVTTTETLLDALLPPLLVEFSRRHPGVELEIAVTNMVLDLDRHEADVSVRPAADPPEALVGVRIAGLAFAVYEARVGAPDRTAPLAERPWLALDGGISRSPVGRWLRDGIAPKHVALRADSFRVLRDMAVAGLGVAALPCFLGDACPALQRIAEAPEAGSQLWVLTHAEWRHSARVKAFMAHMAKGLARHKDLLEGRAVTK